MELFDQNGCLTEEGLHAVIGGQLAELGRLEAAAHRVLLGEVGAVLRTYSRGETLVLAGQSNRRVGVVLSGAIEACHPAASGARLPISQMGPGGVFGDVLGGSSLSSPVTVMASAPCEVLLVPYEQLLLSDGSPAHQRVLQKLVRTISDNYFKLVDLALENKVSQMMLLLDDILGKGFDGGNMIQGLAQHVRNVMMAKDTQTLPLLETSDEQKAKYVEQAKKAPTPFLYKALQLMNNCDVQYRQSSNKRLLVELTLIQIGQITQPEDQDVPSAGRTPHRLKSLFQKIVAQLKPASQGAGAGQESGSKAPITGAQPVAAATAAPVSTGNHGSQEAASTDSPKAKNILKSPGQIKLSGIGMSFANLEKTEQNSQRIYNPIDQLKDEPMAGGTASHDQPFTQEQVEGQWISMCLRMQGIKDFIGLANRMKPIVPTITDFPHIEVVIDNKLLLDDVVKIKGRILQTFRIGLNNSQVTLDYRLAESDEVTRILSKREILENMIKENPAIGKLTQDLRLVMA